MTDNNVILEIDSLCKAFGPIQAVSQFSLAVQKNEVVGIIGPNGAGKTTLFNLISGILRSDSGGIYLNGVETAALKPYQLARMGLVRTFQGTRLFNYLSVLDNMLLAYENKKSDWAILKDTIVFTNERKTKITLPNKIQGVVQQLGLGGSVESMGRELSYGQRKLLGLGLCTVADAKLVLLDEPISGISPSLINEILDSIKRLANHNVGVIVIDHNIEAISKICDRIVLMDKGKKVIDGTPDRILSDAQTLSVFQ